MNGRWGLAFALIAFGAIWALTFPLTKIAVIGGYRNFGITFWSSCVTVILLGIMEFVRKQRLPLHAAALRRYLFVALFGTILYCLNVYTAAEHLPSGVISVCMSLIPMASMAMAVGLGLDKLATRRVLGLFCGLVGVLLIILPQASLPDPNAYFYVLLVVLGVLSIAVEGNGLAKFGRAGLDPIQLLLGSSIITVILVLPLALMTNTTIIPSSNFGVAEWAVLFSGVANTVSYVGYVWLVGRAGSVFAAQVAYVVTGFGVVWSILLIGESYSIWVWAAMAIIMFGLSLVQPRPSRNMIL